MRGRRKGERVREGGGEEEDGNEGGGIEKMEWGREGGGELGRERKW